MSIRSSFDENILTPTAYQLTAACRAAFCIAAPMVQMSEECVAVMTPGCFRHSFVEVPGSTHLDTVIHFPAHMERWDSAPFGLHHVFAANLANRAHQRTSSLFKKVFSASIFVGVVVPEPTVVLNGSQVKAMSAIVLFMFDDHGRAFVVRAIAGQFFAGHQFHEFLVSHGLHLFLYQVKPGQHHPG